jgi:hypothetical protein
MRYAAKARILLLIVPLSVSGACDNGEIPTGPTAPPITETFTGQLTQNGASVHPFTATAQGTVTATLTGVDPSTSPAIGFSMGTWNGTACTAIVANDLATSAAALTGTVIAASNLCVRLYDPQGTVPADTPVNYTVQVVHP